MRWINDHSETFGAWASAQQDREGGIGQPVAVANTDRDIPRVGDPEAIRKCPRGEYAEGNLFDAAEDAKTDGLAY